MGNLATRITGYTDLLRHYIHDFKRGDRRIRTAVRGFADLCLTTRPCRHHFLFFALSFVRPTGLEPRKHCFRNLVLPDFTTSKLGVCCEQNCLKFPFCTPDRTRTCNLLLRRQLLYPVELRAPEIDQYFNCRGDIVMTIPPKHRADFKYSAACYNFQLKLKA